PVDPESLTCRIDTLQALLEGGQVKIVALPHVSNLLGGIVDVAAITRAVHDAGARVVVDGVAYAPHRPIDVAAWNVDWYVYSTYKVYGPHMGALYGRADAVEELTGPNHFFVPRNLIPYKFQLGGACHEGCAGLLSLGPYLNFLAGAGENGQTTREMVVRAFLAMADLELPLQKLLIDYLRERRGLKVIGPQHGERSRVTTISFLASKRRSSELATALNRHGLGVRSGSAYAYRLCQKLGIDPEEGVVRASMVHYNMLDEVRRLIEALETELPN
ncbi:MAG: aminotransferase class V-fold PLP-dependent enzyme, partial [Fimbriimonas ginsengisoli]|nr:aminotransferase class V-fold PLP-dependent enzyme [Fimbriimonas ginsengisoli]